VDAIDYDVGMCDDTVTVYMDSTINVNLAFRSKIILFYYLHDFQTLVITVDGLNDSSHPALDLFDRNGN
jgi:hypothetical protein